MREVTTVLPVSREEAFRVLEDPRSFERLVGGARKIRRFDTCWPDDGTVIHHTVGIPPFLIRDTTKVTGIVRPELLRLEARAWPIGAFTVEFEFADDPSGCLMKVREKPTSGFVARPGLKTVVGAGVILRNLDLCRRYRSLIKSRQTAVGSA